MAEYISSINLSKGDTWSYELKTLPRPKGKATRVIYTEYDLPRQTIEPHDVIVAHGAVWYSNFGEQFLGKLDPKTGNVTEYPMPDPKAKDPHSLAFDQNGNLIAARRVPHAQRLVVRAAHDAPIRQHGHAAHEGRGVPPHHLLAYS